VCEYASAVIDAIESDSSLIYDLNDVARVLRFFDLFAAGDKAAYRAIGLLPPIVQALSAVISAIAAAARPTASAATTSNRPSVGLSLMASSFMTFQNLTNPLCPEPFHFAYDALTFVAHRIYDEAEGKGDDAEADASMDAGKYLSARDRMHMI